MLNLKDLAHNVENVTHSLTNKISHVAHDLTHNLAHAAHEVAHDIADLARPLGDKVENFFKEKGINVTRETRHGNDSHNIIANSDGSFVTNNNSDFTRKLLNYVLFADKGEIRIGNAMSGDQNPQLQRISNPQKNICPTTAVQLAPNNDKSHD